MNGGTCLRETPAKQRVLRGRRKNARCNRSSLLTNPLPYKLTTGLRPTYSG
jgi:hypothetical protein